MSDIPDVETTDAKRSLDAALGQIFASVKIVVPEGDWDVCAWAEAYLDSSYDFMVVKHVLGKDEKPHYHVVGVPKPGVSHLKVDEDIKQPHPGRGSGRKPIQAKFGYDDQHFKYLLKPKEWKKQGKDMIYMSTFDEAATEVLVQESAEHAATLKTAIHDRILSLPISNDPKEFHQRALSVALRFCSERKREPGPWLTHKVRFAVWTRSIEFRQYIESLYR